MEIPTMPLGWGLRVTLRHLYPCDLRSFQAYRHDPLVGKFQGWSPQSDDDSLSFLTRMNQTRPFEPGCWFQMAIADRETNELLGDIGVLVRSDERSAEIGFTLRPESQGQGLACEAVSLAVALVFDRTPVELIEAVIDSRNERALALATRIGMVRKRVRRAGFRGKPCTEIVHGFCRKKARVKATRRTQTVI